MADFNKILTPGDYKKGELNVVIEIPTGSNHKIEWDREHACFMLDRVEPMAFAKPCNYGFIPQTLDEDGDEPGHGTMSRGTPCVPADDRNNGDLYNTLEDLPKQLIKQIEFHFNHYKDLKKPGTTEVKAFEGVEEAKKVIEAAIKRFK